MAADGHGRLQHLQLPHTICHRACVLCLHWCLSEQLQLQQLTKLSHLLSAGNCVPSSLVARLPNVLQQKNTTTPSRCCIAKAQVAVGLQCRHCNTAHA
jgi:hypothetical protein